MGKILNDWVPRENVLKTFLKSIKDHSTRCPQLAITYKIVKSLLDFEISSEEVKRKLALLRVRYLQNDFQIFPGIARADGTIKEREKWLEQIENGVSVKIDAAISTEDTLPFVQTI